MDVLCLGVNQESLWLQVEQLWTNTAFGWSLYNYSESVQPEARGKKQLADEVQAKLLLMLV